MKITDVEFKFLVESFWREKSNVDMSIPGWYLSLEEWARHQFNQAYHDEYIDRTF